MRHGFAILTVLILTLPSASLAGPRPGVEAGGSLVWLGYPETIDAWQELNRRLDFNAALTLHWRFGGHWGLVAGPRYSRLGNEIEFDEDVTQDLGSGGTGSFTTLQQYLGVPILARWDFRDSGGPFLLAGTEVAWLLAADQETHFDVPTRADEEDDILEYMNRYNVAVVVGGGFALGVGPHELEFALRYAHGLTGTSQDDRWISSWKTRELTLTVGFRR